MPHYLLLKSGYPSRLPLVVMGYDAVDLNAARSFFASIKGVPPATIALDSKSAITAPGGLYVEAAARSLHDDGTPRKKKFPAAMRARRPFRKPR